MNEVRFVHLLEKAADSYAISAQYKAKKSSIPSDAGNALVDTAVCLALREIIKAIRND